jgi:DNA-binding Lrp family transcriptional regulator
MAVAQQNGMDISLNDTDRAILREIDEHGRATTTLLAEVVDVSRTYAGDRIRRLREHEYLSEVAPNLYDITDAGQRRLEEE